MQNKKMGQIGPKATDKTKNIKHNYITTNSFYIP